MLPARSRLPLTAALVCTSACQTLFGIEGDRTYEPGDDGVASVVSSGLPIVLLSRPLPLSRPLASSSRILDPRILGEEHYNVVSAFIKSMRATDPDAAVYWMMRMIEAGVGVGVLPESAARRHARSMAIRLVPLSDAWALRSMQICVRSLDDLPGFARDLIDLLSEDALHA